MPVLKPPKPPEDDNQTLRPGFASEEPDDDLEEPGPDPKTLMGQAHYAGMTPEEADAAFSAETLCTTCVCAPVCRVAEPAAKSLSVISRCVAFLPSGR